jgi:hypothetical protein
VGSFLPRGGEQAGGDVPVPEDSLADLVLVHSEGASQCPLFTSIVDDDVFDAHGEVEHPPGLGPHAGPMVVLALMAPNRCRNRRPPWSAHTAGAARSCSPNSAGTA